MSDSAPDSPSGDRSAFKALLAAWSLIIVVLGAAGFSSRWNYYYNFGLQNLVLQAPLATLPIYTLEIIRDPHNLVDLLRWTAMLLIPFEVLRFSVAWTINTVWADQQDREEAALDRLARAIDAIRAGRLTSLGGSTRPRAVSRLSMLHEGLVVDAIRAGLIIYIAFVVGGIAGTRDYWVNVVDGTSRLPKVTIVAPADRSDATEPRVQLPFICDTRPLLDRHPNDTPPAIGDNATLQFLTGGGGCSSRERSWRLLLRDEKFVYLFATVPNTIGGRPVTLVLPNSDKLVLIMR